MATRFYKMQFDPNRPVFWEDLGNLMSVSGLVLQGQGQTFIALTPSTDKFPSFGHIPVEVLNTEDWARLLAATDDPQVLTMDPAGGATKAWHRKLQVGAISGDVQQKVWAADARSFSHGGFPHGGFPHCLYCGREMGEVQLSIDHWIPLELGGANDVSNYLTACRNCNKKKGMMDPHDWCVKFSFVEHSFEWYTGYLAQRVIKP